MANNLKENITPAFGVNLILKKRPGRKKRGVHLDRGANFKKKKGRWRGKLRSPSFA